MLNQVENVTICISTISREITSTFTSSEKNKWHNEMLHEVERHFVLWSALKPFIYLFLKKHGPKSPIMKKRKGGS